MAHVARIDADNVVRNVHVINNTELPDDGAFTAEAEAAAQAFQAALGLTPQGSRWLLTSYNNNFRFNYAGIGFTFDPDKGPDGGFIPPQPFESWVLDEDTCAWEAPVEYPADGAVYVWDEEAGNWVEAPGA